MVEILEYILHQGHLTFRSLLLVKVHTIYL